MAGDKKVLLIIDDDEAVHTRFSEALTEYDNVECIHALSPAEGIMKLEERIRDLDLVMIDGHFGTGVLTGEDIVDTIIMHGYTGMMVAMSTNEELSKGMLRAGCRDSVRKENAVREVVSFLRLE